MSQTTTRTVLSAVGDSFDSQSVYRYLAAVTLVSTYVLMLLGAYTSAIGAGLSCPDWPTCYGTWIPFLNPEVVTNAPYSALQIFAEWAHRGLAMVVGLLIVGTVLTAWNGQRDLLKQARTASSWPRVSRDSWSSTCVLRSSHRTLPRKGCG